MSILEAGQKIGSFLLVDQIGSTQMGEVWRAWDSANQTVALKTIAMPIRGDLHFAARFQREAEEQRKLHHSSIVPIYDFFSEGDGLFLVMPYIAGGSLADLIERDGRLSVRRALEIALQVLQALDYAHQNMVIHRDVKPSNILLDGDQAYLSDFGIALSIGKTRLTSGICVLGTPEYMSPEQILNPLGIDHLTDVYGFGCVLYEMLAGTPPFFSGSTAGSASYDVQYKQLHETATPLRELNSEVPVRLERIVMTALAKSPEDRFPGCGSFGKALESVLAELDPPPAPPDPQSTPTPPPVKTRKRSALANIVTAVAGLILPFTFPNSRYAPWVFIGGVLLCAIVHLRLLHAAWKTIQDGHPRATPGRAVGWLFIPFFGLYWGSQAYPGFASDYNRLIARNGSPGVTQPVWFYWFFYIAEFLATPVLTVAQSGKLALYVFWVNAAFIGPLMIAMLCRAVNQADANYKQVLG